MRFVRLEELLEDLKVRRVAVRYAGPCGDGRSGSDGGGAFRWRSCVCAPFQ